MLKVGVPSAAETSLYHLSQLVITSIVLIYLSENELIAKTYVQSITMFFYLFAVAIGQASQILIGHLVGAERYEEAYRQCYRSHRIALLIMFVSCGFGVLLRQQLAGLFTGNPEVIALCSDILLLNCVLELGRTTNLVVIACMRGGRLLPDSLRDRVELGVERTRLLSAGGRFPYGDLRDVDRSCRRRMCPRRADAAALEEQQMALQARGPQGTRRLSERDAGARRIILSYGD